MSAARSSCSRRRLRRVIARRPTIASRAARALHLSQPALHVQVKKLSEQLGVALYRRKGRVLELTPEGRRTVGFGRELLERSARFVESLHGAERARPIVLSAGEGAFLHVLGERVRAMVTAKLTLRMLVHDAESTVEAVTSGEAHLGVAALHEPPEELEARRVVCTGNVLVVPRAHRLARRSRIGIEDLASEPLVVPPRGRPQREALEVAAHTSGIELRVTVEVLGWPLTLRFVELGVGVAIVNDVVAVPRGLTAIRLRGLPEQTYWALRRRGARPSPEAQRAWALLTRERSASTPRQGKARP